MNGNTVKRSMIGVSTLDYKMWVTIMLTLLLPTLYTTARIHFLGELPAAWGYNIASQLAWVNVMYEVVHEALLLPLYYLIGTVAHQPAEYRNRILTGLIASIGVYTVMGALVSLFTPELVHLMAQSEELSPATVSYIRLETVAKLPEIAFRFLTIVLVLENRYRVLLGLLLLQLAMTVALDALLIRSAEGSLGLGVNGIAASNFLTNGVLSVIALRVLARSHSWHRSTRSAEGRGSLSVIWMSEWTRIGGYSGLESLVRNAAFILMVLRMVNIIEEPGTYWVANNFIWGWLLLPVLALGTLIKRDVAERASRSLEAGRYMWLTAGIVAVWLATIPAWRWFFDFVMGVGNAETVFRICVISLPFYVVFAVNNVIDSIFYGRGRTDLMLVQAIVVNGILYGSLFGLYKAGIYVPTLERVAVMFGAGIALDAAVTFLLYYRRFRKN